jgi:hypothetical protein
LLRRVIGVDAVIAADEARNRQEGRTTMIPKPRAPELSTREPSHEPSTHEPFGM